MIINNMGNLKLLFVEFSEVLYSELVVEIFI